MFIRRKNLLRKPHGFTVVELAVVIAIIGILATVTVVSYNGYQKRADNLAVSADLLALNAEMTAFMNHHNHYPSSDAELLSLDFDAATAAYMKDASGIVLTYCTNHQRPTPTSTTMPAFGFIARSASGALFYTSNKVGAEVVEIDATTASAWNSSQAGIFCAANTGVKRGDPVAFSYYEASTGPTYFVRGDWAGFK